MTIAVLKHAGLVSQKLLGNIDWELRSAALKKIFFLIAICDILCFKKQTSYLIVQLAYIQLKKKISLLHFKIFKSTENALGVFF